MSYQERGELERTKSILENQLENINQENRIQIQETNDLQKEAERMRVQTEKILAKCSKERNCTNCVQGEK